MQRRDIEAVMLAAELFHFFAAFLQHRGGKARCRLPAVIIKPVEQMIECQPQPRTACRGERRDQAA